MKALFINGSPRENSNTLFALKEAEKVFREEGIETEILDIGKLDVRGCLSCYSCYKTGKCAIDDIVNEAAEKFREADALIVGSPVYYASVNATVLAFMQRLFYSTSFDKQLKVGMPIVVCRRAGSTAALEELNKFFNYCGMPVAGGTYWNLIHGRKPGEAQFDAEEINTIRNSAHNAIFLMKSIALGKEKYGDSVLEGKVMTHFVRQDLM